MKEENLLEVMEGIREDYIAEARTGNPKKRSKKLFPLVACMVFLFVVAAFVMPHVQKGSSYKAVAAEKGKEEIQLGATMPSILYYGADQVIMYDYIGIWVYDLKQEQLIGFCDFRPLQMTQIQGNPCVFVDASTDGKYVRFYKSDESIKYLYDVKKDSYKEVDDYDKTLSWEFTLEDVTETHRLSDHSETYKIGTDSYLSYKLEPEGDETIRYKDLILVLEKAGKKTTYRPFTVK